jgi:hypothetical protein
MNEYAPDYWQVIRLVNGNETIYKLFSSWVGGYVNSDSWKLNSGITSIKKVEKVSQMTHGPKIVTVKIVTVAYDVAGVSGSVYRVPARENCYRTTAYTGGILQSIMNKTNAEILPYDTDWENLI